MAKHITPTPEQQKEWEEWLASKPESVQKLAALKPPELLYRLKTSGHRVVVYSYGEDNTMSVIVGSIYNQIATNRIVFGVKPEDLEECDLPGPDDPVGLLPDPVAEAIEEIVRNDPEVKHRRLVNKVSPN